MNINDINKTVIFDFDETLTSFMILEGFRREARKWGWSEEEIICVWKHASSQDRAHLIETIKTFCE